MLYCFVLQVPLLYCLVLTRVTCTEHCVQSPRSTESMLRPGLQHSARNALLCPCVAFHRGCALPAKLRGLPSGGGRCRRKRLVPPVQMGRRSSKIAMRKGVQDAKKAKLWGKYGKLILQAAKAGGPSPEGNIRLGEVCRACQLFSVFPCFQSVYVYPGLNISKPDSCTERHARALQVLKAAKLAEVPRDVIDRNLKKASDKQQADFSEVCRLARSCCGLCLNMQ